MTEENEKLLAIIQDGAIPAGYTKVWHLMPEEWKDVPLSDIFTKKIKKNKGNSVKTVFTNSAVNGIIPQSEYFEKNIANSENTEGYFVVNPMDYVYNPRISENAPYGPFKRNDTGIAGIVSPLYTVLTPRKEFCESEFLHYYLESTQWHKYAYSIANYGARFDRMNITGDELMRLPIAWPSLAEQERIAEILKQCDKVIELKRGLIDELKKLKKECLRRMFPQKGQDKPEIRLPGFTDAWEQRKLGDLALFNPKEELPNTFEYVDLESVVGTEMLSYRTETKQTAPSRAQRLAHKGDLFYQTVRPYQKNNYLFEKPDKHYVFSTGYAQLRPRVDGYFLLSLVQSEQFVKVVLDNCTGTSYPAINANDLADIDVSAPTNASECTQIGEYFRNLDHLITLHQHELEQLKKKKKALAQLLLTGIVRVNL